MKAAIQPLTPEWYAARRQGIGSSEIAAVLGLSPWTSPFDLWWQKASGVDSQPDNQGMRRGRRLEPLVLEDFSDAHPELTLTPSPLRVHPTRPWQMASPDALAYESGGPYAAPVAVVESKTGATRNEWGERGTDQIPVHYRCQCLWLLDVLALDVCYVPVWFGTTYAEYVVERDDDDLAFMREKAEAFLASLAEGREPPVDDTTATARRLKRMHPDVEPGEREVPIGWVRQYHAARRLRDAAEARMRLAENRIRHALGPLQTATAEGRKVATRSVYDVAERTQTVRGHTVHKLTFTKPPTESQERTLR